MLRKTRMGRLYYEVCQDCEGFAPIADNGCCASCNGPDGMYVRGDIIQKNGSYDLEDFPNGIDFVEACKHARNVGAYISNGVQRFGPC